MGMGMEYRQLSRSGLRVSLLGLGGNTFGRYADQAGVAAIVSQALDLGVTFFDTADVYGNGVSEELLGKALAGRRDRALIATKVGMQMGPGPNESGSSRKRVIEGCEASLRRLGTDFIDLYQIHRFDPATPLDETLGAQDDLVRAGKVR
jgi:aryl-alcohol dehydrogenase-like predicted oxidoreductase